MNWFSLFRTLTINKSTRDLNSAARLYQDLDQHTSVVGAYQYAESNSHRIDFSGRIADVAFASCDVTAPEPEELEPGCDRARVLVRAPSVWHAVIHLMQENRNWLAGRYGGIRSPLIFRGQRDPTWSLIPSINRAGVNREHEMNSARCLAKLTSAAFRAHRVPKLMTPFVDAIAGFPPQSIGNKGSLHVSWTSMAQHYGVATSLLDFTMDPAVAAWFASLGAPMGQEVTIFALPTQWTDHAGVRITLPHPLSDRLFRQRGVFVDATRLSPSDLRQLCIEVRFPADHSFLPLRRNYRSDILVQEPWWDTTVEKARKIARDGSMNEFLRTPTEKIDLERLVGTSRFPGSDALFDHFAHSVRELTQMLIAFTISIQGDTVSPLRDGIRSFTRENRDFLLLMLPAVRASLRACDEGSKLREAGLTMTDFVEYELMMPPSSQQPRNASRAPDGRNWSEWAQDIMTQGGTHLLHSVPMNYVEPACSALREAGATVTVQPDSGGVFVLLVKCKRMIS